MVKGLAPPLPIRGGQLTVAAVCGPGREWGVPLEPGSPKGSPALTGSCTWEFRVAGFPARMNGSSGARASRLG